MIYVQLSCLCISCASSIIRVLIASSGTRTSFYLCLSLRQPASSYPVMGGRHHLQAMVFLMQTPNTRHDDSMLVSFRYCTISKYSISVVPSSHHWTHSGTGLLMHRHTSSWCQPFSKVDNAQFASKQGDDCCWIQTWHVWYAVMWLNSDHNIAKPALWASI